MYKISNATQKMIYNSFYQLMKPLITIHAQECSSHERFVQPPAKSNTVSLAQSNMSF
jgi:hypothetical protein